MPPKLFRNVILLALLGLGAFAYYDPLKPSDDEAKAAILASLLAADDGQVTAITVKRSFSARHMLSGREERLWPVNATVIKDGREVPDHDYYLMKGSSGRWVAETDDPQDKHWEDSGFFGIRRFGM